MYDCQMESAIEKDVKKICPKQLREKVRDGVIKVRTDPFCGSPKTGDPNGLTAIGVDDSGASYRLGYYFDEGRNVVVFVLFDTRENFYARAKRLFASVKRFGLSAFRLRLLRMCG